MRPVSSTAFRLSNITRCLPCSQPVPGIRFLLLSVYREGNWPSPTRLPVSGQSTAPRAPRRSCPPPLHRDMRMMAVARRLDSSGDLCCTHGPGGQSPPRPVLRWRSGLAHKLPTTNNRFPLFRMASPAVASIPCRSLFPLTFAHGGQEQSCPPPQTMEDKDRR